MKWIKYQVVQCTVGEEDVLITKKIGYSDANIAIAQAEAYNGEYTVIEDEKSFDKEPLAIKFGGTDADNPAGALQNLGITSGTEDLIAGTSPLATGAVYLVYE